jgi:hypothetical protein
MRNTALLVRPCVRSITWAGFKNYRTLYVTLWCVLIPRVGCVKRLDYDPSSRLGPDNACYFSTSIIFLSLPYFQTVTRRCFIRIVGLVREPIQRSVNATYFVIFYYAVYLVLVFLNVL